jgi:ProP effector
VHKQDHDVIIAKLARLFPKAFFVDPKQRIPLKHGIIRDVEEQGCQDLIGVDIEAAVGWYMTHVGYYYCLIAGEPRVDLNGKPGSKVTAQEAKVAQQNVTDARNVMKTKKSAAVTNPMQHVAHLGQDLMRKVEAPRLTPPNPRLELSPADLVVSMTKKLTRVSGLLDSEDDEFRAEFLEKVLKELRADIDELSTRIK